jgi:hypothetical protein
MAADRVTLNQVIPQTTVRCRKCGAQTEILAHILGQCTGKKPQRMRRHDDIRDFITNKISSNQLTTQIIEQGSFETPTGTLKPDLVLIDRGRVNMIDVTARHEDAGYLPGGFNEKINKYSNLVPILAERFHVDPRKVLPVVVGNRGAIPKSTIASLKELEIKDRGSFITISLLALRSSLEVYHAFLDYDKSQIVFIMVLNFLDRIFFSITH